MALFTGTYRRNLDGKNRVLIPAEVRDALDSADRQGLFLIPSRNLVFLWPRSYLDSYTERQSVDPMGKTGFNRAFYSQMIFKPFDGTGRIRIRYLTPSAMFDGWRPRLEWRSTNRVISLPIPRCGRHPPICGLRTTVGSIKERGIPPPENTEIRRGLRR